MTASGKGPGSLADVARRRWDGTFPVDPWGYDADVAGLVDPLLALRWAVDVTGSHFVPASGPVLVVFSRRWGLSEPAVLAHGLRRATGRRVRVAGAPDVAPIGVMARRLGGVGSHPADLAGVLQAGELLAVGLRRSGFRRRPNAPDPDVLLPALVAGAPIVPAALRGREPGRRWQVTLGRPVQRHDGDAVTAADAARHLGTELATLG